jgi:hypothetical protein
VHYAPPAPGDEIDKVPKAAGGETTDQTSAKED